MIEDTKIPAIILPSLGRFVNQVLAVKQEDSWERGRLTLFSRTGSRSRGFSWLLYFFGFVFHASMNDFKNHFPHGLVDAVVNDFAD